MTSGRLTLLVTLLLALAPPGVLSGSEDGRALSPEEIRAVAAGIVGGKSYQQKLVPNDNSSSPADEIRNRKRSEEAGIELPTGSARSGGPFFTILLYLAIGVAGILVLLWLGVYIEERLAMRGEGGADRAGPDDGAGGGDPRLLEAERLAAEGRFDEAVHALLLLSVEHLCAVREFTPGPATTSRELVRTLPGSGDERTWFGRLVRSVEISLFGTRPLDAEEYGHCLDAYRRLVA